MPAPLAEALEAWGGGQVLGPLTGGARSRLWRVELGVSRYVARISADCEAGLRWLLPVQRFGRRAGLVISGPVATRSGALSAGGYTIEPYLEGRPGRACDLRPLAASMARFHRLSAGVPARPGHPGFAGMAARLPEALGRRLSRLAPGGRMGAVHGDLHPGNLLRLADGRLALIDWEEARRDHPAFDGLRPGSILHLAYEIAAGWRAEPGHARRLARRLIGTGGARG